MVRGCHLEFHKTVRHTQSGCSVVRIEEKVLLHGQQLNVTIPSRMHAEPSHIIHIMDACLYMCTAHAEPSNSNGWCTPFLLTKTKSVTARTTR